MNFDFGEQFRLGQKGEAFLDEFFADRFNIKNATTQEQREGIDRHFTNKETGATFTVEYKTDWVAVRTHNAFIETVSVDTENKPGWARHSRAYRLIYLVPGNAFVIYVLRMAKVREQLPRWIKTYPLRKIPNTTYFTHGICVPLTEFEKYAEIVY